MTLERSYGSPGRTGWHFENVNDSSGAFSFLEGLFWPADLDPALIGVKVHLDCQWACDSYPDRPDDNHRIVSIRVWDDDERTVEGKNWQEVSAAYLELLKADRNLKIHRSLVDRLLLR